MSGSHGFSPYRHALELLASATARKDAEPECSVTVSRNFKQDYTFEVVVRGPSVTECNLMAQYEVDLLAVKYPAGGAVSPQEPSRGSSDPDVDAKHRKRAAVTT